MNFKRENSQKLFKGEIRQSFNHPPFEAAIRGKGIIWFIALFTM